MTRRSGARVRDETVANSAGLVRFGLAALPAGTAAASLAKAVLALYVNKVGLARRRAKLAEWRAD